MAKNKSEVEAAKQQAILNNPCFEESNVTRKCLERNNYVHDQCTLHFNNFKRCKQFWNQVRWARKKEGIIPELPDLEERKKIKAEYMEKLHR